jgi:hypothetical protein
MAKAELKTKQTKSSVKDFINSLSSKQEQEDSFELVKLMQQASGEKPAMWGTAIIGFGNRTTKYASGRELDWFSVGFSPRKGKFALYGLKKDAKLLAKLGKHKLGGGCLYINRLSEVDKNVLKNLIAGSVK